MPLFALPAPKIGTRFYDGKNRKLVFTLTELKDNRIHGQAVDGAALQHKFWQIDEWEKMTGLKIGQDLLDTMIITPPPPPKAKAAKPAQEKPAKATKTPKTAKAKPAKAAPAIAPYDICDTAILATAHATYLAPDKNTHDANRSLFDYDGRQWLCVRQTTTHAGCLRVHPENEPIAPSTTKYKDTYTGRTIIVDGRKFIIGAQELRINKPLNTTIQSAKAPTTTAEILDRDPDATTLTAKMLESRPPAFNKFELHPDHKGNYLGRNQDNIPLYQNGDIQRYWFDEHGDQHIEPLGTNRKKLTFWLNTAELREQTRLTTAPTPTPPAPVTEPPTFPALVMTCPIMKKNVKELSLVELGTIEGLVRSELRALAAGKQPIMPDGSAWPANLTNYQEMLEQVLVVAAEASERLTTAPPPAPAPDPRDDVPAASKEVAAASDGRIVICTPQPAAKTATATTQPKLQPGSFVINIDQVHCTPKLRDANEPKRRAKVAEEIRAAGDLKSPLWVYLFAPDPNCAFGGNPHGPLAQYELYEHDERTFRAVTEILGWTQIRVQLRDGRPTPTPEPPVTPEPPTPEPQAPTTEPPAAPVKAAINSMPPAAIEAELQEYVAAGWQLVTTEDRGRTYNRMVHTQDQIATPDQIKLAGLLAIMRGDLYKTNQEFVVWQQANTPAAPTPAAPAEPVLTAEEIAEQRKAAFGAWGWEQEYSDFFLAEMDRIGRPILWGCAPDALPTIHAWQPEDGRDDHLGFGVFRIRSADFEAFFDAGGAMAHHGPISYTTVDVRKGVMPAWYNLATVRATLLQLKEQAKAFDAQLAAAQSAGAAEQPVTAVTAPSAEQPDTELPAGATVETHAGIDFVFAPLVQPEPAAALTAQLPVVANQPPTTNQIVSVTALPPTTQDLAILGAPPQHNNYDPGRVDLLYGLAPLADYKPSHFAHLGSSCADFTPPAQAINYTIHQMLEQMRFNLKAPNRWGMVMRSVINATGGQSIIAYANDADKTWPGASKFDPKTGLIHSNTFISWRANIPGFFRFHVAYEWGADTYTVRLWRAIDPKLNNGKVGELVNERDDVYCDMLDETIDRMYIAGCNQYNAHAIDLDTPTWVPLPNPQLPTRSSRAVTSRSKYN